MSWKIYSNILSLLFIFSIIFSTIMIYNESGIFSAFGFGLLSFIIILLMLTINNIIITLNSTMLYIAKLEENIDLLNSKINDIKKDVKNA